MHLLKKSKFFLAGLMTVFCFYFNALAAGGGIDSGFTGYVARTGGFASNSQIRVSEKLPDGKYLVAGNFKVFANFGKSNIVRLNPDGTVDPTFTPPDIAGGNEVIYSIGVFPDGKIMIGGDFQFVNGINLPRIARLNPDGTPDTAFNTQLHSQISIFFGGIVYDIEVLPNGQFYLAGDFILGLPPNASQSAPVYRINADGSHDNTFNATQVLMSARKIYILPDGKLIVAGNGQQSFNFTGMARLETNGAIDFSFSGVNVSGTINDFEMLPNGQMLVGGSFTLLNGFVQGRLSRINPNGSVDLNFMGSNVGANGDIQTLEVMPAGQILVGGAFSSFNGVAKPRLVRIFSDAGIDVNFNYTQPNDGIVQTVINFSNGTIFVGGSNGSWDKIALLNNGGVMQNSNFVIGVPGEVKTLLQQPDGKILVAGDFNHANGGTVNKLLRLNLDGSKDASFNPTGLPVSYLLNRIVLQPDGKILIGSAFPHQAFRLNSDGSLDTTFDSVLSANTVTVNDFAVLPDGKILAAGLLTVSGSTDQLRIVRLLPNGALDPSFTSLPMDGRITRLKVQPDGKILIAGDFTQINSFLRGRIARLNSDGTLDHTFNPLGGANGTVWDIALQTDEKVVLGGNFTGLNGSFGQVHVGRLNSNGSLDTTFVQQANAPVESIALQPDGKLIISGGMTAVGSLQRYGIARLNQDGTVDTGFQPSPGSNGRIGRVLVQTDGKILAGGNFSRYNGENKISLVRILSAANGGADFDYDGDGKADISIFRPATNRWYQVLSGNSSIVEKDFGLSGDIIAPADFDGDGKTDIAIFRPSSGDWWYLSSVTNVQTNVRFGAAGDIPRPSDFDGDGKADFVVFRPSNNVWYRLGSTGQISIIAFGLSGDKPVVGDFDGDGKGDVAVFRPSTGEWWYGESSNNNQHRVERWGLSSDIAVPADYDGDGKTDFAVFRPSTGVWYVRQSSNGAPLITAFGLSEDKPAAADYDGDGKADLAVFRPSTGVWYLLRSTNGFTAYQFGLSDDLPTQGAFIQ